jgi:hypothetical protein
MKVGCTRRRPRNLESAAQKANANASATGSRNYPRNDTRPPAPAEPHVDRKIETTNPAFALDYSKGERGTTRAQFLDLSHPFSAGALCSTVGDLVKWQRVLDAGQVVSPQSYALMTTADTLNNGRPINYGFGLVPGIVNGRWCRICCAWCTVPHQFGNVRSKTGYVKTTRTSDT